MADDNCRSIIELVQRCSQFYPDELETLLNASVEGMTNLAIDSSSVLVGGKQITDKKREKLYRSLEPNSRQVILKALQMYLKASGVRHMRSVSTANEAKSGCDRATGSDNHD